MIFLKTLIPWIILSLVVGNTASNFEMIFNNFSCTSEDPHGYLNKLSCLLSKSVKRRTFSMEMQFKKNVDKFFLNLRIEMPRKDGNNFILLNLTQIDGCSWMLNKNQVTLMKIGRSLMDRFSNIPHQCPYKKDTLYYIRGYRLDMKLLPAFKFEAEMLIWFDFIVDRSKIIKGFMHSFVTMNKRKGN